MKPLTREFNTAKMFINIQAHSEIDSGPFTFLFFEIKWRLEMQKTEIVVPMRRDLADYIFLLERKWDETITR